MPKQKIPDRLTPENWEVWKGKPVAVFWEDACFHPDPEDEPVDPEIGITWGVIKEWTKEKLELIGEVFPLSHGKRRVTGIPAANVKDVLPWKSWKIPDHHAKRILEKTTGATLVR